MLQRLPFIFIILLCACAKQDLQSAHNGLSHIDQLPDSLKLVCNTYLKAYNSTSDKESFIFFTDPHLMGSHNNFTEKDIRTFQSSFEVMKILSDVLPFSFCLCGGDWLSAGDTPRTAIGKLEYEDNYMNMLFPNYYKMLGNHDTNYQGLSSEEGESPIISNEILNSQYFKKEHNTYYFFKSNSTTYFILDSGLDSKPEMDSYRFEQLEWLAGKMMTEENLHIAIGVHIFFKGVSADSLSTPFCKELTSLCNAYNRRTTYQINDSEFDFSNCQGKVEYIISGHNHIDFHTVRDNIPIIGTRRFNKNGVNSFDMCLVDYESRMIYLYRIGLGENRVFPLAN